VKQEESLVSIIAFVVALSLTLLLFFSNFTFVLTIKLLQTGQVNVERYFFALTVTIVNAGILAWLGYILSKKQIINLQQFWQTLQKFLDPQPQYSRSLQRPSQSHYRVRQEKAEQSLRKFSQNNPKFTIQESLDVTGLNVHEAQNLIDSLILKKSLKAESQKDSFVYYFIN